MKLYAAMLVSALALSASHGTRAADVDAAAAEALARKSGCFTCHSLTNEKDAPALATIAKKYAGDVDAEKKLQTHLTTNPMVEIFGEEERHDGLKTQDPGEVANVVRWILSL